MMEEERRQHKRFELKSFPLTMVSATNSLISVFSNRVIDISEGGMAFSYIGWEKWSKKDYSLELIDEDIYLDSLPIKIISDIPLTGSLSYRRCGVNFAGLNSRQKEILQDYIEKKKNQ